MADNSTPLGRMALALAIGRKEKRKTLADRVITVVRLVGAAVKGTSHARFRATRD